MKRFFEWSVAWQSLDLEFQMSQSKKNFVVILFYFPLQKPSSSREVSHMKFTSWKERALPNVALFVGFVTATREARKKYESSKAPTIVHCRSVFARLL